MASITLTFIDGEFGIQNFTYNLKDEDLRRLYKASCINKGMVPEYFEKRLSLEDTPMVREIVKDLSDKFVTNLVQQVYNLELANAQNDFQKSMLPINIVESKG